MPRIHTALAPRQALGYSLQTTRLLALLLQANPGDTVSLEVFEDAGIETISGERKAIQVASRTADSNPVSDRSPKLWRTLANWVTAVNERLLDPDRTSFVLYLARPATGPIVELLQAAHNDESAQLALAEIKQTLWGAAPAYPERAAIATNIQQDVELVLTSDEVSLIKIIRGFRLESGSGCSQSDIEALLERTATPEEIIADVQYALMGWVKSKTDGMLEKRLPAVIAFDDFRKEMTAVIRKLDRRTILSSYAGLPTNADVRAHLETRIPTYVHQLDIIECDTDEKMQAVSDFLRAKTDRIIWAEKGFVHSTSFDEHEDDLTRVWTGRRQKICNLYPDRTDVQKGKAIYGECCCHKGKLEGLELPSHFCLGSFHALADRKRIGWHPSYLELIGPQEC